MPSQSAMLTARLPLECKESGNRVFAELGYTPSELINLLWRFAAAHAEDPTAVKKQLEAIEEGCRPRNEELVAAAELGPKAVSALREQLGTADVAAFDGDAKALRELAYMEGWAD